ncbi:MAG: hypothetical protein ACKOE2_08585 [Actinomycetales bacterium]
MSEMTPAPDEAYEDLPFDELRHRAFRVAEHRLDLGFFTDLFSHMPGMVAIEGEGGDLGAVGGTIIETVRAVREMFGGADLDPTTEALLRARFATYLREHQ